VDISTALEDKITGFSGDAYSIELRQYQLKGRIAEGVIKVEYWLHCWLGDWVPLASDQAKMLSGIGWIDRERDQVAIGQDACFTWRIPYVTDDQTGKGWAIDIYSEAPARTVASNPDLADMTGRICYTATAADFTVDPSRRNELRATLRNELWDKKFDVITSIDIEGAGPTLTITEFTPKHPEQGDTVKVTWDAAPNADTRLPIAKVVVQYGFGGVEDTQVLPADAREFSFVVGAAGNVRFVAIAYDSANRPSPTDSVDITVGEPSAPILDFALWVILAFALIGLFVGWRFAKGNIILLIVIFLIFLAIGIAASVPISNAIEGAVG
jgi:hypothetical protein